MSVNWYRWRDVGMALEQFEYHPELDGLTPEEGCHIFRRLLANPLPELIVAMQEPVEAGKRFTEESRTTTVATAVAQTAEDVSSETPAQQLVISVWQGLLGTQNIDVQDNFFALGGDSLLATQVIFHLEKLFQMELSIQQFFAQPTVAGVTEALASLCGGHETLETIAETWQEVINNPTPNQ